MRILATAFLLLAAATHVVARDVRVLIAPRSLTVPRSGKILFDVSWINDGSRRGVIPGAGVFSFSCASVDPGTDPGGTYAQLFSHSPPDRQIPPRSVVRDTAEAELDAGGAKLLEVTGRFRGKRVKFESNSVVLRVHQ